MANVNDLARRLQRLIDDDLDMIDIVDWFNQCNESLNNIVYLPTRVPVDKDANGNFPMPTDCNGELRILSPDNVEAYDVYDDTIHFDGDADVATIDVAYNKRLKTITNDPTEIPVLKDQFHSVYVFYGSMQAMHPEEEPDRYSQYEKDYYRIYQQIEKYYSKMRPKPAQWTVVR